MRDTHPTLMSWRYFRVLDGVARLILLGPCHQQSDEIVHLLQVHAHFGGFLARRIQFQLHLRHAFELGIEPFRHGGKLVCDDGEDVLPGDARACRPAFAGGSAFAGCAAFARWPAFAWNVPGSLGQAGFSLRPYGTRRQGRARIPISAWTRECACQADAVACDPLIWEQHPDADRWTAPVCRDFRDFFRGAMESGGALVGVITAR